MPDSVWQPFAAALLGTWPGRFDAELVAAYVHEVQARGVTDPEQALRALRSVVSEHPPSAATLAALAKRDGQGDPPSFEEVIAYASRTLATSTRYGNDALAAYVARVAGELHEAPARWVAAIGIAALRGIPEPHSPVERAQRRDHAKGYAEICEAWRTNPQAGVAVETAMIRDSVAGREVPAWLGHGELRQIEGGR